MRHYLLAILAAFAVSVFATNPPIDIAEVENQFTQATLDAQVIEISC